MNFVSVAQCQPADDRANEMARVRLRLIAGVPWPFLHSCSIQRTAGFAKRRNWQACRTGCV